MWRTGSLKGLPGSTVPRARSWDAISLEMAKAALPYADGLYLMTPFNRVALMERLIGRLKQEVLGAY